MVRYLLLSLLATVAMVFQSHAQTHFDWVSPQPHRQDWLDVTYGNGVYVGVTDGFGGRYLYTSRDGETWTRPEASISGTLRKVIFADGKFIAVGDRGQVLVSADGLIWSARQIGGSPTLMDVAIGNGVAVTVENAPRIYCSRDMETWTSAPGLGTGYVFLHVEFGNGQFLAVAQGSRLWRSADGVNWTPLGLPNVVDGPVWSDYEGPDVIFSNGRFLLANDERTLSSTDGVEWKDGDNAGGLYYVGAAPGGFVGVRNTSMVRSSDGVAWETVGEFPWHGWIKGLAIGPGGWLLAGSAGLKIVSEDGSRWSNRSDEIDYSRGQVAFANGRFVRYGAAEGLFISTDGASWDAVANTPGFSGLAGGNSVWVGVSADGSRALVSDDARDWRAATGLAGTLHKRVVFGGGIFAVGTSEGVATSADGQSWTMHSIAGGGPVTMIGYLNGRFAAFAADRRAVTSDDGVNWTAHDGKFVSGGHFAAGNDRFVGIWGAGMGPGNVAWSLDGINWFTQRLSSGSTHSNDSLTFGGGVFLETDYYGNIYESRDGIVWQGQRQAPQGFGSSAYGNGTWIVVGGDSILRSVSDRAAGAALAANVELRFETTGQVVLRLNGPSNGLLRLRQAAEIDGQWSDVTTVRLSGEGTGAYPVSLSGTSGFFSATVLAE